MRMRIPPGQRIDGPRLTIRSVALVAIGLAGCDGLFPPAPRDDTLLEGPVEGLSGPQLQLHFSGDEEFARRFAAAQGLGPVFVAPGCEACHPGDGKGPPVFTLTRFGRMTPQGFDPMRAEGGPQLQERAIQRYIAERIPNGATGVARFTPPAVTGLGFLDAVDDSTLLAMTDPTDADGDGLSGRVQLIDSTTLIADVVSLSGLAATGEPGRGRPIGGQYIGRFGKKALTVNLLHQTINAYHEDMGLTTDLIPVDIFNPQAGNLTTDAVPDPEVGTSVVQNVVFYLQTLRQPPRRRASSAQVVAGEATFAAIGCAGCHRAALTTGSSPIAALDRKVFYPYTDLLLHDMGPDLDDGYTEGIALTSEWRTAPLWGLGLAGSTQGGRPFYLHDGRARTLPEAIDLHGGEGAASRAAFRALSPGQQTQLLAFLESL